MVVMSMSGYDTYPGSSWRMSPFLSWQGLDSTIIPKKPSDLQTSSHLYDSSLPWQIRWFAVTLFIRLLRFFFFLVVNFLPLSNNGLSDLERQTVPRFVLKNVELGKEKTIYEIDCIITIHLKLSVMSAIVVSYYFKIRFKSFISNISGLIS